ncbi:MAG: helix-turn-helix domain-containing protein [Candidatus Thalassarchaeaceae archaeon]|nr:helix-turn-helix domain-containing protein [Candidatus Thalassarchaeaceae archaeon]
MVVSGVSILDVPPLPGNPFDIRPVERSRAHEMVGCEGILSRWREHMHSQSPRMMLLVGERGSGRTSLVNSLSSQTGKHFVGYYWNDEDPVNRFLSELSVTFCGHNVPNTMHQTVENLVETLDSSTGSLPLIAIDYPPDAEMSDFLVAISPILQRLRAFVVAILTNSQFASLDEGVKALFQPPEYVPALSEHQIQQLCDSRLRRISRERWNIQPSLLSAIHSRSGGNPREVLSLMRDLLDEKRDLGSEGTLERLVKWDVPSKEVQPESPEVAEEPELSDWADDPYPGEEIKESEQELGDDEDDWDVEPDDLWDDDPDSLEEEVEETEEPEEILPKEEKTPDSSLDTSRITDWNPESETILTMEEGTEPPRVSMPSGGFSGLLGRTRSASDNMDTGPDNTPVVDSSTLQESEGPQEAPTPAPIPEPQPPARIVSTEPKPPDYLGVISTDGEQWTVDSDLEATLPDPSEEQEEGEPIDSIEPEPEFEGSDVETEYAKVEPPKSISIGPRWDSSDSLDETHLGSMNDAERLVVSIASEREISPSDAEIQARLEVGRPRLSQIYNSLYRSGILSARKEGRSRLFKISEMASELIP